MFNKDQYDTFSCSFTKEIGEFVMFRRQSGFSYRNSEYALKSFDMFCMTMKNLALNPQQLVDAWVQAGDKQKYNAGYAIGKLGQYLTAQGHPKAFTLLSEKGKAQQTLFITTGPFTNEIKEFIDQKRSTDRKYINSEYALKAFDNFCALKANEKLTPQQFADAWYQKVMDKDIGYDIATIRELGLYLTIQGSSKSFAIPHTNGGMPKPAFTGYTSVFAKEIVSFLQIKRSAGLKYRHEEFRLKEFDRFCAERINLELSSQQLVDLFVHHTEKYVYSKKKRSISIIKAFGKYLNDNRCSKAFSIIDKKTFTGPYAEDISIFIAFKKSCGFKYGRHSSHLRAFDKFCASEENENMTSQQMADKWILKRENEHPNTRVSRLSSVRVFGKYLTNIGHPKAFIIPSDTAKGVAPKPPYLFSEDDIEIFFSVCANLIPDEKDPSLHIVLPAAFLFMYCMGVRTCELKILLKNVNFKTGEVIIASAKTGDRAIYMSEELVAVLYKYKSLTEKIFPCHKYLFPGSVDRSRDDFAKQFKIMWTSSVPAGICGEPRFYDLRHHFLYRNVELCMRNGDDVNVLQPYIMKHMGHKLPASFQYYFHLSPPIRNEISQIKKSLDWMIPDVPEVPYE